LIDDRPRYMISIAAELVGMHPQTLRIYETRASSARTDAREHPPLLEADLERLRLIQRLTTELGLNLAGVEVVLRLEDELRRAHERWSGSTVRCAKRSRTFTSSTGATSCSTGTAAGSTRQR